MRLSSAWALTPTPLKCPPCARIGGAEACPGLPRALLRPLHTHLHSTESFGCDEADHLECLAGQQAARLGPACAGDEAGLQAGSGGGEVKTGEVGRWRGEDRRGVAWGRETRPSWPKRMEPHAFPPPAIATPPAPTQTSLGLCPAPLSNPSSFPPWRASMTSMSNER